MSTRLSTWVKSLALLLILGAGMSAFAQFSSKVQGTVSDSTGAVVVNADVTLSSLDTALVRSTKTNESGIYRFVSLAAGPYVVVVKQPGFADANKSVTVTSDEVAGVNVQLVVAGSATSMQVNSAAPILNPEETRTQYTLDENEIRNLPNQNSATLGLVRLAPGVTGIVEGLDNLNENRNLPEANANGRDSSSNLYTLDGVPINSSQQFASAYSGNVNGQIVFVPNLSSIGNVALQTTTFAVSYGSAASMVVAFGTKSGGNKWHGVADESYGDKVLNAYAYNVPHEGAQHRHVYSFGVGGPIYKNHTFFWGSYEGRNDLEAGIGGATEYFTPQFSSFIANPANDPNQLSVTAFIKNAPNTRVRFVPNPADQTAAQYFGGCKNGATTTSYNTPCSMLVTENGITAASHLVNGKNYSARVDHTFNGGNDRLYGYYFSMDQNSDSQAPSPAWDGYTPTNGRDISGNYTHIFSSSVVNQANFGYWNFDFGFTTTPHSAKMVEAPFLFLNLGVNNFTRFVPFSDNEKQYYGRDSLLWTHGKHNLDLGVEVADNISNDDRTGIYSRPLLYLWFSHQDFFDDKQDLLILANYYSGVSGKHIKAVNAGENLRTGIYAQDSWKVRPNLTLTYGIRWDDLGNPNPYGQTVPFANITNRVPSGVIKSTDFVKSLNIGAVKRAYTSRQNGNIDPRIGIAWAPYRNDYSTVLRGGFGLYQDLPNLQIVSQQVTSNPPGSIGYTGCCGGTVGYGTNTDASKGYGFTNIPDSIAPPMYNKDGSVVGQQANIQGVDPKFKPQRSMLWDLSLEHQFPRNMVAALTYTGSHSYNLTYTPDLNRPNGSATNINIPANSETTTLANTNFGGVSPLLSGLAANANDLTANLRQNLRGYQWQVSYNWAHAKSDPTGFGDEGFVNQYDPHAEYADSPYDVRQGFKAAALIPINARTSNRTVNAILGGWSLNNVVVGQTGTPFTVYYNNQGGATDFAANNRGYQVPDYRGSARSFTRTQWKNGIFPLSNSTSDCGDLPKPCYVGFSRPKGALGNQGRNSFRNAAYLTWDANVQKRIDLPWMGGEKSHLTLRVDGYNIPNRFNPSNIKSNNGGAGGQQIDGGTGPRASSSNQARILQLGARFEF